MKKVFFAIILTSLMLPCYSKDKGPKMPNVFITDTTEAEEYIEPDNITLKGYAEYMNDMEAVYLKDENDQFILNLKVPQKITSKKLTDEHKKILTQKPVTYSKYGAEEYNIGPQGRVSSVSTGGLSFGTTYDQEIDYSEFEQTAGFFTRYDIGKFGVKTSYERTIGSTYGNYIDNIYIAPEIRLNKIFSVKEVLSANMTYRRKKAEFVLSVNPFANTNDDRLNLELGASQTYYEDSDFVRSKIKFNTRFKL